MSALVSGKTFRELKIQVVEAVDEVVEIVSDAAGVGLAFGNSDGQADSFATIANQFDVPLASGHFDRVAAAEEL